MCVIVKLFNCILDTVFQRSLVEGVPRNGVL